MVASRRRIARRGADGLEAPALPMTTDVSVADDAIDVASEGPREGTGAGVVADDSSLPPPPKVPSLAVRFLVDTEHRVPCVDEASAVGGGGNGGLPGKSPRQMRLQTMVINSRVGVPVETDLFVGHALLLIRPVDSAAEDPYYHDRLFSKKKRRLEVQFQGRFKRRPVGMLFCGGEITEQMKLGLVSKGLCNMLLRLVSKVSGGMHHSFGDGLVDGSSAHIVFPAWSMFDRIVITEPGGAIPPLGITFDEAQASINARRSSPSSGKWNTTDTYSMSFHNMYLNLATWNLVNLPVTKDLDLRMFWGEGMLRLVMYDFIGGGKKEHVRKNIKYYLGVEIEFQSIDSKDSESEPGNDEDELPWDKARSGMKKITSYSDLKIMQQQNDFENFSTNSSLHDIEGDGEESSSDSDETLFFDANSSVPDVRFDGNGVHETGSATQDVRRNEKVDSMCPGWVKFWRGKGKSTPKYSTYFAVVVGGRLVFFRGWKQFQHSFPKDLGGIDLGGFNVSPRASSEEKQRRLLGLMLASGNLRDETAGETDSIQRVVGETTKCDRTFLRRSTGSITRPAMKGQLLFLEFVARAWSERHWVEECVVITENHISFHQPGNKYPIYRIEMEGIVAVEAMDETEAPYFPTFFFVSIETVGRTTYVMVLNVEKQQELVNIVSKFLPTGRDERPAEPIDDSERLSSSLSQYGGTELHLSFDDPAEEFLHKSTLWRGKQRRVLNCQEFVFRSIDADNIHVHPCDQVRDVLAKAFYLKENLTRASLLSFLRSASHLKGVDARLLSERERLVFFLNLYHVMVLHSFYVLGAPSSVVKWASYFNCVSYQCCDDIFSLAELEHCIIRANMSSPAQFVSKFVVPKTVYPLFALRQADFRLNFALNCGSFSNPEQILVYDTLNVDEQLDMATKIYIRESMNVSWKGAKCIVTLPRVCSWYNADFGSGQPVDAATILEKYYPLLQEGNISLSHASDVKVKFLPYNFKCRQLSLLR